MLTYKGYAAKIDINLEGECLHGRVLDINDTVTFEGKTVEDIKRQFHRSVDEYLEHCKETGQQPDKPFQGKIAFRTTPETHRAIYLAATQAEMSINAWMDEVLNQAARRTLNHESDVLANSNSSLIQRIHKQKNAIAELMANATPFLRDQSPYGGMQFVGALEKLLLGLEAVKPYLNEGDPSTLAAFVQQMEATLRALDLVKPGPSMRESVMR